MKKEMLHLDHIQQYMYKCAKGKKPDFIKSVFDTCSLTQTVIFVNSKDFAERLHNMMRKASYSSVNIFGNMSAEERDEMVS